MGQKALRLTDGCDRIEQLSIEVSVEPKMSSVVRMKYSPFCVPALLLYYFLVSPVYGQGLTAGTLGGSAVRVGVGARTAAMGHTFTAVADDVSSIYWNPAGLGQIKRPQLTIMGADWLGGIRHGWIGFGQSLGKWMSVGADVSYIWSGDIPQTIESEADVGRYQEMGTFNYNDMVIRVAIGSGEISTNVYRGIDWGTIRIGGAFQVSQQRVNYSTITGYQLRWNHINLGMIYQPPVKNLKLGLSVFNIGSSEQQYLQQPVSIPQHVRVGLAYTITIAMPSTVVNNTNTRPSLLQNQMTVAVDYDFGYDQNGRSHIGLEYLFSNGFAMRGGYRRRLDADFLSSLSGGFGYATRAYQVDYAFIPFGQVGNAHRISLSLDF